MAKILGIGGIFFTSKDPEKLKSWYKETLGLESNEFASIFHWKDMQQKTTGVTLWSPFPENTEYFAPSEKSFMVNFVVDDIEKIKEELESKGVPILSQIDEAQGKFLHLLDIEGNKVELWEPIS